MNEQVVRSIRHHLNVCIKLIAIIAEHRYILADVTIAIRSTYENTISDIDTSNSGFTDRPSLFTLGGLDCEV